MTDLASAWEKTDFWNELKQRGYKRILVAYSGGLDSTVLMHLCRQAPVPVRAMHIHHGLQTMADDWLLHCQNTAQQFNIPLQVFRLTTSPPTGASIEAWAREQRYQALMATLQPDECLVTAHHQQDQAETLLLQLCRGAGLKGMAAMPCWRMTEKGMHARPLLDYSRSMLLAYAQIQQLVYCEDPSNQDFRFVRNRLREQIFPLLMQAFPNVHTTLARTAAHCAEAMQLLDELAHQDLPTLHEPALDILHLKNLSLPRQKNVLRAWLAAQGLSMPSELKLRLLLTEVIASRYDKVPLLTWADIEVRRCGHRLYAYKSLPLLPDRWSVDWDLQTDLILPAALGVLHKADFISYLSSAPLRVRFRSEGDTCLLPGQTQHKSLKKLMQAWGVLPWLRDRVVLVFAGEYLLYAKGYYQAPAGMDTT